MNYSEMNLSIQKGEFLEYGEHEGQLYGTKLSTIRDIINDGKCAILDVEPTALRLLKNKVFAPLVVYVAPGNGGERTMGYEVYFFIFIRAFSSNDDFEIHFINILCAIEI